MIDDVCVQQWIGITLHIKPASGLVRWSVHGGIAQRCQENQRYVRIKLHSTASCAAIRRFATPSLVFMRWKRELIELLLT